MNASVERRAMAERYLSAAVLVLHEQRKGRPLEDLVVYVIDLLDPFGRALARGMHARAGGPDPDVSVRAALAARPARRPIWIGLATWAELAALAEEVAPSLIEVPAQLREPAPPVHVRFLVVGDGGAELSYVPDVETPAQRERRALLEREAAHIEEILDRTGKRHALNEIVIVIIDLLDPLGHALGSVLRAQVGAPDPAALIRRELGESTPVRPIILGVMKPAALADRCAWISPALGRVVAELRAPKQLPPHRVRVLVVARGGAELAQVAVGDATGEA